MRNGGGNYLKYLKRGWNRKEGRGNKDFKKGEQAGSRGGCFKKDIHRHIGKNLFKVINRKLSPLILTLNIFHSLLLLLCIVKKGYSLIHSLLFKEKV